MTVLKLFYLTFIYTSSLIIKKKEKKRKSQSFKTALNYFCLTIHIQFKTEKQETFVKETIIFEEHSHV